MAMHILQATTPEQITAIRDLFKEYAEELGVDLCFQGFSAELVGLPGAYAMPRGRLLLAEETGQAAGCVALRPVDETVCEMKRLFVRRAYQGSGFGRALAERVISEARAIGYSSMVLDTLPNLQAALRLYDSLGFQPCPAYYRTPLPGTVFLKLQL